MCQDINLSKITGEELQDILSPLSFFFRRFAHHEHRRVCGKKRASVSAARMTENASLRVTETPRLQKNHCHQLWYSLLPGADTCLVSAPAQNCVKHVESARFPVGSVLEETHPKNAN